MKLNEIKGMSHYLEYDCYCPGEVYDLTGFFYKIYTGKEEIKKLGQRESELIVLCDKQLLMIAIDGDTVQCITRFDATENNIKESKNFIDGVCDKIKVDEFEKGSTEKSLKEIMGMADAIMTS